MIDTLKNKKNLEPVSAKEYLDDTGVTWHSVRGFDPAGVKSILTSGLRPAENQGELSVSLSASPAMSRRVGVDMTSFRTYSLRGGMSVGFEGYSRRPDQDYGGFTDEVRPYFYSLLKPVTVMVPEEALDAELSVQTTEFEGRKPRQFELYVTRNIREIESHGVVLAADRLQELSELVEQQLSVDMADSTIQNRANQIILEMYSELLLAADKDPTVRNLLELVVADNPEVTVSAYTADDVAELEAANEVARRDMAVSHGIGALSFVSMSSVPPSMTDLEDSNERVLARANRRSIQRAHMRSR